MGSLSSVTGPFESVHLAALKAVLQIQSLTVRQECSGVAAPAHHTQVAFLDPNCDRVMMLAT